MRDHILASCLLAGALLLCGCASQAPRAAECSQNAPSSGGEDPSTEGIAHRRRAELTELDGRWFLVEPDGEDVEGAFEVHGRSGTFREGHDTLGEPAPLAVERREDGAWMLSVDGRRRTTSEDRQWLLVPLGPDAAWAIVPGANDLLIARRAGPLPEALHGHWTAIGDGRGLVGMTITADQISLDTGDSAPTEARAFGLRGLDGTMDVVIEPRAADRTWIGWLRFLPLGERALLVTEGAEDTYVMLNRSSREPNAERQ